jgi:hypothetical protein
MTALIGTYLCTFLSNTRILSVMIVFFVCTFPGILVQIWCKSATMRIAVPIIGVVVQPDGGPVAPGTVDLDIEREVLLPPADRDPVLAALRHGGVVEADRGALLQEAGIRGPAVVVAVEEPPGLVIGEAEGVLEEPDGEDLDPHALDRRKRRGLVLRQFGLLAAGFAVEGTVESCRRREVFFPGDHRPVAVAVALEKEEPGPALDQVKEHARVPAVLGRREPYPPGKRDPDGKDLLFDDLPDRPAGEDVVLFRAAAGRLGLLHVVEHSSILVDGVVDPGREHPVHHLVVADLLDLRKPPDAPLRDGADPELALGREGPMLDRLAEVCGRGLEDLLEVVGEGDVVEEEDGAGPEVVVVVERFVADGALEFVGVGDEVLHR